MTPLTPPCAGRLSRERSETDLPRVRQRGSHVKPLTKVHGEHRRALLPFRENARCQLRIHLPELPLARSAPRLERDEAVSVIVELNDAAEEKIALAWIEKQRNTTEGYKLVLKTLFKTLHTSPWSWLDALSFAARFCCSRYAVNMQFIRDNLEK